MRSWEGEYCVKSKVKVGGRKTIGNDIFVDVLITVTLLVCFYGTFSGMAAAMVGGLFASIILFVAVIGSTCKIRLIRWICG